MQSLLLLFHCGFFCRGANRSDNKAKATTDFHQLSLSVAFPYKLSNKFIEDMQRIMDFVEHNHINLTR